MCHPQLEISVAFSVCIARDFKNSIWNYLKSNKQLFLQSSWRKGNYFSSKGEFHFLLLEMVGNDVIFYLVTEKINCSIHQVLYHVRLVYVYIPIFSKSRWNGLFSSLQHSATAARFFFSPWMIAFKISNVLFSSHPGQLLRKREQSVECCM